MLVSVFIIVAIALAWTALLWHVLGVCCRNVWDLPFVVADIAFTASRTALCILLRRGHARFPEWTTAFEFTQSVSHMVFEKYGQNMLLPANVKVIRTASGVLGSFQGQYSCRESNSTVELVVLNELEHLWIRGDDAGISEASPSDRYVVLYYHGGGYSMFGPRMYITVCNRLRQAILDSVHKTTGARVTVEVFLANYRKSPEAQFPVPQEDALRMLEYLRDQEGVKPEQLILAGDSAGGGLVMSTLLRLRDHRGNAAQPLAAIVSYPWTDLAYDPNPDRGQFCVLSRDFVRASLQVFMPTYDDASTWKDASSAYCDLRGLAPVFIQVGTQDYLYQDALKLFSKAQDDGINDWEMDIRPNMAHTFTMLPFSIVPDAAPAFACMGAFVAKQIAARQGADNQHKDSSS